MDERGVTAPEAPSDYSAARLEGALLAARGIAHRLNNDLTGALGSLSVALAAHPDLPPDVRERLEQTARYLQQATAHPEQSQRIARIVTRDTPGGPVLDVECSLQTEQRSIL
ncbi:MAG TPA: hypothetical protein VII06_36710 [Chloroflexota bacterium]|jgi:hypothetical protein